MSADTTPDESPRRDRPNTASAAPTDDDHDHADGESLHPVDAAWIARRSAMGPLVLGLVAIATSPILLGLPFGALGIRSGIDLWQRGARRATVALAVATASAGVLLSVAAAVAWGALLAGVLLSRDAIREAESLRGRTVAASAADDGVSLARPPAGMQRLAVLFVSVETAPCADAIRDLATAAAKHGDVAVVVVDPASPTPAVEAFALRHAPEGAKFSAIGAPRTIPDPLDRIAASPTLVIIDREGRVEKALVGAHPVADLEKLLRGDAALPDSGAKPSRGGR